MTRYWLTASALALASAGGTQAQQIVDLGTVTIYAQQVPLDLGRSGATVDVIEKQALDNTGATTAADQLATLPGVSVVSNGGPGTLSDVRVRGLAPYYSPVLYNGIEITDPSSTQTQFNFGNLLPGAVDRAELIRGSQSARFGGGAISGVIALDGAKAPEPGERFLSYSMEVGSYGTRSGTLETGIATDRAGVALGFSSLSIEGFSAVEDAFPDDDGFDGTQVSLDSYFDLTDTLRVGLSAFRFDGTVEYDNCGWPASGDCVSDAVSKGLRGYAELMTGAVDHVLDVTAYRIDRENTENGVASRFEGERDTIGYRGTWFASDRYALSFGADWEREAAPQLGEETTTAGLFAEATWTPRADLDVAVSLRHDDHSSFGGFTSGRAALAWTFAPATTLRAVLSNGFRAPSLNELYGPFGANPDLDPEQSQSFELGLEHGYANGTVVRATAFYTEIDDLIGYTTAYTQVPGTSVTQGIEFAGQVPLGSRAMLDGSFTYTDARDANDDPLQRVPRYDLSLTLSGEITQRMTGALSVQHLADWADTFGTGFAPEPVEDFTVVNARLGYDITDAVEAYLRVENLFDTDYQRIPDYQTPGRSVYFGINADF